MAYTSDPILNLPFIYINGLNLVYNSTTVLNVNAGQCRDSTNVYDIIVADQLTVNAAVNGLNGLDTGSLGANAVYNVYVIADPQGYNKTGAILSLSASAPQMPKGIIPNTAYSIYRRIGAVATNNSSQIVKFYQSGTGAARTLVYDSPLTLTMNGSTTAVNLQLNTVVPSINGIEVYFNVKFTPATAANILSMNCFGSSATPPDSQVVLSGSVAAVAQTFPPFLMYTALNTFFNPAITYQTTSASDAITAYVAGYVDNL